MMNNKVANCNFLIPHPVHLLWQLFTQHKTGIFVFLKSFFQKCDVLRLHDAWSNLGHSVDTPINILYFIDLITILLNDENTA